MFERVLRYFRRRVQRAEYVVTLHAQDEMESDGLGIYDVEHGVLTGQIIERQRDELTLELKYRIRGVGVAGQAVEVVVKRSPTGKMVIITVYLA